MTKNVAVINFGMGNLFSVARALEAVGLTPVITGDPADADAAGAVILPGVGAFGTAMERLAATGLDRAILRAVDRGKPVVGICLGLQLMMEESHEFGVHRGLGIFRGAVRRLRDAGKNGSRERVPHVGWKPIARNAAPWEGTLLEGVEPGAWMYFVHSFVAHPEGEQPLTLVPHGDDAFCGALARDNVFACQFHPEKSGGQGLAVYANLARRLGVDAR